MTPLPHNEAQTIAARVNLPLARIRAIEKLVLKQAKQNLKKNTL